MTTDSEKPKKLALLLPSNSPDLDLPVWDENNSHFAAEAEQLLIIASQPRCGSHMLGQMLQSDGRFGVPLEYFHLRHFGAWEQRLREETGKNEVSASMVLSKLRQVRTSHSGIMSIKAHWSQFEPMLDTAIAPQLKQAKFVILERRDKLAQAISYVIADQTNQWVSEHQAVSEPVYNRELINARLARIDQQIAGWLEFLTSNSLCYMTVIYEDLVSQPQKTINDIAAFMGLKKIYTGKKMPEIPTSRQANAINDRWKSLFESGADTDPDRS